LPPEVVQAVGDHNFCFAFGVANRAKRKKTQDGRKLRRYRKRWRVERLFAWLRNFRRLVTRYEYHAANFLAFVQLACIMILLRHF